MDLLRHRTPTALPRPSLTSGQDPEFAFTCINEAGHAVADHILGFRPMFIEGAAAYNDGRTQVFATSCEGYIRTSYGRERADDLAVALIAGIAAESKFRKLPSSELRDTAGRDDYRQLRQLFRLIPTRGVGKPSTSLWCSQLGLWEAQAAHLVRQPYVWRAIRNLLKSGGNLGRAAILEAIQSRKSR